MTTHPQTILASELKRLQSNQEIWLNKLSFDKNDEECKFWVMDFQKKIEETIFAMSILNIMPDDEI